MPEQGWERADGGTAPVAEGRGWERASNGEKSLLPPDFAEQPVGQRVKTVAGIAGKQIAQGLAGVGDMLLGIPGVAVQTLAGGVYDVAGSLASLKSGQTSKQVLSQASEMARNVDPFSEKASALLSKLTGQSKQELQDNPIEHAMGMVSNLVHNLGEWAETKTQGVVPAEAVDQLAIAALPVAIELGLKGAKTAFKGSEKPSGGKPDNYDEFLQAQGAPGTVSPKDQTLSAHDKALNTEQQAYDLMRRGASKREVEQAIKKNPDLELAMQRARDRYASAKDSFNRAKQGEILGPDEPRGKADFGNPDQKRFPRNLPQERGNVDPRLLAGGAGAAALGIAAYKNPDEATMLAKFGALGGALLMTGGRASDAFKAGSLGAELGKGRYTLKTLERLPQGRTEISLSTIRQQLNRADVPKAEREAVETILAGRSEAPIRAKDLVNDFRLVTGDHELEAKNTGQYADYGLENIGRITRFGYSHTEAEIGENRNIIPETTLYRLPKTYEVPDTNHFNDPHLFGWTRSFTENGVPHVVEIQSDLAQHAGKVLSEGEREAIGNVIEKAIATRRQLARAYDLIDDYSQVPSYGNFLQASRILKDLGHSPKETIRDLRDQVHTLLEQADLQLAEQKAKLSNAAPSEISPILPHWPRRLIREELAKQAKAGASVVRFADADTVAKVEGWPESEGRRRLNRAQEELAVELEWEQRIKNRPEIYGDERIRINQEKLQELRETIAEYQNSPPFRPEHQSIYNRYNRDIASYLKTLGAKPYTDQHGHGWLEVSIDKAREQTGGPRTNMYGQIDPRLAATMGTVAGGALVGAYLADDRNKFFGLLTGAAGAALGLRLLKPLVEKLPPSLGTKEAYVKNVVDRLGPQYEQAARFHWDQLQKAITTDPKVGGKTVTEQAESLSDGQYQLLKQREATMIRTKTYFEQLSPEVRKIASSERMYDAQEGEVPGAANRLTPEEQAVKASILDPLTRRLEALYREAVRVNEGKEIADLDPHNPRMTKRRWMDKVVSFGEGAFPGSGFVRQAGSMKGRSMFGLQMPDGSLRVVNQQGRDLIGYGPDRNPIGVIARSGKELKVGENVTVAGGTAKLVQVPTRMIESQTKLEYSKNALANKLAAVAELESYIRERKWMGETLKALTDQGYAIKADSAAGIPKGFRRVLGDRALEQYYIQNRLANTFQDGVLKSGSSTNLLERINSAAVGTMFWNPYPHLFNAADHLIDSVGWGWFDPRQLQTLGKEFYQAYKDVSTLSPDYQKYLNSGMALQYAAVVTRDTVANLIKGIPERGWKAMAEEYGYGARPDRMIADIFDKSRRILWGGSDVMMITAYKHLASKKGTDILNQAIRRHVEAHNPTYRVPSNIGFDELMKIPNMPEAVAESISRFASRAMQSRIGNLFGRYHYGQMKSFGHLMRDNLVQDAKSIETRGEAQAHLAFSAFKLFVVYPYMLDSIAKYLSGDPDAEMRRAGATTIPNVFYHVILGDKKVNDLLKEAWSLPPATKMIAELDANRQMFTGKHIWEPGDNALGAANDVGLWAVGSMISPARDAMDISSGHKSGKQFALGAIGIKSKTPEQKAKTEAYKAREASEARRRQLQRRYLKD